MATSVLRDQQYTLDVRSLLAAEKALLIRIERPGRHVATTDATIAAVDAFVRSEEISSKLCLDPDPGDFHSLT